MKKYYICLLSNERGIIFPWVYALGSILILLTVFAAAQYKSQILSTHVLKEYYQLQSLFHYSHDQLLVKLNGQTHYTEVLSEQFILPLGQSTVDCTLTAGRYDCKWQLKLITGTTKQINRFYELSQYSSINAAAHNRSRVLCFMHNVSLFP
ncbi:hypothetical protein [Halobacillus naozhouensis]|uniref:Competence protein ComGG n=1 Tax=Halobacillus naozhouensis TaxID=554880 RepID=A0ABY8IXG2_9BACI|nr:hypothetical protein [Halobacillus naozhouensis]WFT73250.1 hypothetical protein P9989_12640 [Halobacillus naozhouensis]